MNKECIKDLQPVLQKTITRNNLALYDFRDSDYLGIQSSILEHVATWNMRILADGIGRRTILE